MFNLMGTGHFCANVYPFEKTHSDEILLCCGKWTIIVKHGTLSAGNLLTQTDGRGNTTAYEYNAANKETRKIYPGGKKTIEGTTVYDPAKTETYTYNANGTAATKTDRNGKTTSYKNDIHGRV
ncbi:RHS repeat domain-containing protein, partial [Ruminiclostridium hungatei]|uniref:RHS repeat domain-containing protein n=1 Tax=Ruminiclostridium hungatei TaxID=48256 RepID=UPI0010545464